MTLKHEAEATIREARRIVAMADTILDLAEREDRAPTILTRIDGYPAGDTAAGLRTISYGGGVQSTAMVVLAAQGVIDYPVALFSNVGDDSEMPETVDYVRNVATPWAAERGVTIHELKRTKRDGSVETLWGRLMKEGSRSLPIPVRMSNGAPGNRSCTADFKIRVVGKWLKEHGASETNPAHVAIGISTDEIQRLNNRKSDAYEIADYPLIELGLDRAACAQIIRDAGLPVPPKSACFFCPFHRPQTWREMRRDQPDLFAKSVLLEETLNARRDAISCHTAGVVAVNVESRWEFHDDIDTREAEEVGLPYDEGDIKHGEWVRWGNCPDCDHRPMRLLPGDLVPSHVKDHVWLTRFNMPLEQAITEAQTPLFDVDGPEGCDEGYCWT